MTTRPSTPLRAAFALAFVLLPLAASAAGTADQKCRASKLKAAGKYAAALASCESKAALDDSTPDAECLSKAAGKMSDAFTKADTTGESTCGGLEPSSSDDVEALVAAIVAAAPSSPGGGKCPSTIYKAGGKYASSLLSAWSKFVTSADATKRDASISKAVGKLGTSVGKGEANTGCAGTGQSAAVETAVEDGAEPLLACLAGTGGCAEEVVQAGESVTTDPDGDGPDAETPITASVETPVAGTVTLNVVDAGMPPSGYAILGQEVEITAPVASAASPLVLTFVIDATLLPPDPQTVAIARNGVVVADCTGAAGVADPDPCVDSRIVLPGGDLEIVALTSQASKWSTLAPEAPAPDYWMRWEVRADEIGNDVATEIDFGWAGFTHDIDPVNGSAIRFGLSCPSASLPGSYGDCTVAGFDPAENNCRCANNTATICDEPSTADMDDCSGAVCTCYTRPPIPALAGGTPLCLVAAAYSNASGDWNPDTGAGDVVLNESFKLHLGMEVPQPCPVCVGDTTANDGVRDGTCDAGQTPGAACDANGTDPTFPAPGGGSTSLDCLPSIGTNISGLGIKFAHVESTASASLGSNIPCVGNISENCPCATCSTDTTVACSSDADCQDQLSDGCSLALGETCSTNDDCTSIDVGPCNTGLMKCIGKLTVNCSSNGDCQNYNAGTCVDPTCTSRGTGENVQPNSCLTLCGAGVDGEGTCDGPDNYYCDGFVDEEGNGSWACLNNTDCNLIGPEAGDCTIQRQNDCYPATITATGVADPDSPRTVAALCIAPTSNSGVNSASGLPGPARLRTDWTVTYGAQP